MGGIFCEFTVGRAGAGSENARYITRASATSSDERTVHLHNYPSWLKEASDYKSLRSNVIEYNRQREEDELQAVRRGGGKTRTHYRCKLSFEGKVDTDKAREMAKEYLEKNFPKARAVAAVHQDTRHTHVHINIQARGTNGRKLNLSDRQFKNLDTAWGKIYAREYGKEKLQAHEMKKAEMRAWKMEYARAKSRGQQPTPAPERTDRGLRAQDHQAREARNYGINEGRTGRDQSRTSGREQTITRGERAIDGFAQQSHRATEAGRGALRQAERIRDRSFERELDRDR